MAYNLKKLHTDANMALIKSGKPLADSQGQIPIAVNGLRIGNDVECYVELTGAITWWAGRPTVLWQVCFLTRDGGVIVERDNKYRELVM